MGGTKGVGGANSPDVYALLATASGPGSGTGPAPYYMAEGAWGTGPSWPGGSGGLGSVARADFPALDQDVNGHRLVWLDNGATTHKPQVVIDRVRRFYESENSNIHRAAHTLAGRATEIYEDARRTVARFLGATDPSEIVLVRGTTEAINLVAATAGAMIVGEGDEIVVSELEHHSNIVPWQMLAERTGARIRVFRSDGDGNLGVAELERVLTDRSRILAITAVSNAIGTVVPLPRLIQAAHAHGALVVVDRAQSIAHLPVDVAALDADFFAFSGHKVFGPSGIGALYGKRHLLDAMPPWQGGGSMIDRVTIERSTYAPVPAKFEAGTGHLAGAAGMAVALDYVEGVGRQAVAEYEDGLMHHLVTRLDELPGVRVVGNPVVRGSAVSFVMDGFEAEDVARHLDRDGIAVRAGHHCAQPALARFGLTKTVRPSLALYNTHADIDALAASLQGIRRLRLATEPGRGSARP
jgi:cysteine desulfurase/selenocysteine lyase